MNNKIIAKKLEENIKLTKALLEKQQELWGIFKLNKEGFLERPYYEQICVLDIMRLYLEEGFISSIPIHYFLGTMQSKTILEDDFHEHLFRQINILSKAIFGSNFSLSFENSYQASISYRSCEEVQMEELINKPRVMETILKFLSESPVKENRIHFHYYDLTIELYSVENKKVKVDVFIDEDDGSFELPRTVRSCSFEELPNHLLKLKKYIDKNILN